MVLLRRHALIPLLTCLLISTASAKAILAQGGRPCSAAVPPSVGVAFGRSSPYLEGLVRGAVGLPAAGSQEVRGGGVLVGRADLSLAGPLRLRIEGGTSDWDVRLVAYDAASSTAATDRSAGYLSVHHLAAFLGLRTGRAPACAHVSAGAGLYSLAFGGTSTWRPGGALAAGIEVPAGEHGAVQLDAELHLVATGGRGFIASSTVPALNLVVGWAYRF